MNRNTEISGCVIGHSTIHTQKHVLEIPVYCHLQTDNTMEGEVIINRSCKYDKERIRVKLGNMHQQNLGGRKVQVNIHLQRKC